MSRSASICRPLVMLIALVLSANVLQAGNLSLDFNHDVLGSTPKEAIIAGAAGTVRVVQHDAKRSGDLSVALAWSDAKANPEMALAPSDKHLPDRGVLFFDLLIGQRGAPLRVLGLTNQGRTAFEFRLEADGKCFTMAADGSKRPIIWLGSAPEISHWFAVTLTYDVPGRLFKAILDGNWPSGDTAGLEVRQGEWLERIVFRGEGAGPAAYYIDAIRLAALEGDANAVGGTAVPLGCHSRKVNFDTPLVNEQDWRSAVIVYPSSMEGGAALGQSVRQAIRDRSGKEVPCLSDELVVDGSTWLLREEFLHRPMIVLGNASDNKAMYALATRFLTQANRKWPGGDRFCVRTVLEPLAADSNWVIVEASTREALAAGVQALCKRIAAAPAQGVTLKYFRELGATKGTWAETPFQVEGIDLSKPIPDIKEQIKKKYGPSVHIAGGGLYYYDAWTWLTGGSPEAAKYAAGVLMLEMERDPWYLLVGHYCYDITIKAWQICFTSGVLDEATVNRVEAAMARTSANPSYMANDWYASAIRQDDGRLMSHFLDRHWIATAANNLVGSDYVLSHCRLNPITREIIEDYHRGYLQTARRLGDFSRARVDGSELGDCSIGMMNLMALSGNLAYVRDGTLARAAELYLATTNNLGFFIGEGAYIGTDALDTIQAGKNIVAAAAFYGKDKQFQWLFNHFKGVPWCSTSKTNLVYEDDQPEEFAQRYLGLFVLPFDKGTYRVLSATGQTTPYWRISVSRAPTAPYEQLMDSAFFRDGYTPDTAFLVLGGSQVRNCMMNNTIPQYTDLGQVLLFSNMQLQDRWCRNGPSASNGKPCPPAVACIKHAEVRGQTASAISSTDPFNGNAECTRTILHRMGHYFVVIDRFKALVDDDYTFTCRWRTPHPAALDNGLWNVQAAQGVKMQLASVDGIQQESMRPTADGHFTPYVLVQQKAGRLQAGRTADIRNFFYASSAARPDQCEARSVDESCILIRGTGKDWNETALVGLGRSPQGLGGIEIDADVFYISPDEVVAANARRVVIGGKSFTSVPGSSNVTASVKDLNLAAVLAKAFESAKPISAAPPQAQAERGLATAWQFQDFARPPVEIRPVAISASRKPWSKPLERLIDPLTTLGISYEHWSVSWKSEPQPLEMTLDLGKVQAIQDLRLQGVAELMYTLKYYWNDGDVAVAAAFSDDNFQKDIRPGKERPKFHVVTFPRAHYSWAGRIQELTVPADTKARYIRLSITTKKPYISFNRIVVNGQERQARLTGELQAADLDGDGKSELVVRTSNNEIVALDAAGKKRWSRLFGDEISVWNAIDLETDGKAEVLAYTTEDACYALEGSGAQRWRLDFFEIYKQQNDPKLIHLLNPDAPPSKGNEELWARWYSPYLFYSITAWRPDAAGKKDIVGWAKVPALEYGITIKPDRHVCGGTTFNAAQFAVPDTKVLGREVLVMSGGQLIVKDASGKNLVERWMKGTAAGNGDFPVFLGAGGVADAKQKGFVAINPAAIEWAPADFGPGWGEFSEVPIRAYLLKDINDDGLTELLVGYTDGFVRVYRPSDGTILGKCCAGASVVGLAALGDKLVVATRDGVISYDGAMKEQGRLNIRATAITTLPIRAGSRPTVCVADDAGVIRAIQEK